MERQEAKLEQLRQDLEFAETQEDELVNRAQILRYVAALNPDCTCKEFVLVADEFGYHPNTARTCFYKSRSIMAELDN